MSEKVLGEFELFTDKIIGKGAWGEVYHGRQKSLNRPVAIKILKKDLTQDESFVRRFRRESEALAQMSDDHIVQVYSAGEHDGSHYFVMEYIKGHPLSDLLERAHKFSTEEIVYVAGSVVGALKSAWDSPAKIVHRDIKPSNIMVAWPKTDQEINILKSKIKVMDFGLAKVASGGQDATMAGTVIGTPKYISPEQGLGNPADIRSDIYSLGIVMYEMATGRIPFESESAVSMIRHHVHDTAIVPSQFNPDIPPDLEKIIIKCIQKGPERRYASPDQLLDDLTAFRQQQKLVHASSAELEATVVSGVARQKPKRHIALYALVISLLLVVGVILTYNYYPDKPGNVLPVLDNTGPKTAIVEAPAITGTQSTPIVDPPVIEDEEFKVEVWTNKPEGVVYKKGDELKFHFRANRDSYIYLFHMDVAGQVQMLFPNGYKKDNKIKADQVYTIPDKKTMNFAFNIKPPFGMEQVKVIASLQPIKDMDIKQGEEGFRKLGKADNIDELKIITRSLEVVPEEARAVDIRTITTSESPEENKTPPE